MTTDRCPTCDKPRAGDVAVSHADGCTCPGCLSVCWRDWGVMCEPADWRARAIAAEARWRKVAPLIAAVEMFVNAPGANGTPGMTRTIGAVRTLLAATKEP